MIYPPTNVLTPTRRENLIVFIDEMTQDIIKRKEKGKRTRYEIFNETNRESLRKRKQKHDD